MIITHEQIKKMETRYRANLINSLGGFKSVTLIGTKSKDEEENVATFSSLFHLGANPALCGIIIRPSTPKRNTLDNILQTGSYTINHIQSAFVKQAHQCSAKYDEGVSEFEATGLTSQYIPSIYAPFVQESVIKFACEFVQKIDIEMNGTYLIIGKIIYVQLPDEVLAKDGFIDIEKAGTVTCSGLDSYHTTSRITRLSYARPQVFCEPISIHF